MLVTKKRLYTELCRITDFVYEVVDSEVRNRRLCDDYLAERINHTLQKVLDLTDRVEALEAKKQTKKTTKKKGNKK